MTTNQITTPVVAKSSGLSDAIEFTKTVVVIVTLVLVIRGSLIEPFKIPSGSMRPTLLEHDYLFVSKLSYGIRLPFITNMLWQYAFPKRGDVVVFTRPDDPTTAGKDESEDNLIKRVMGLPGEKIEVRGDKVYINAEPLTEPYARWIEGGVTDFPATTVPAGHVLLLGDNRDQSKDSRFWIPSPFLDVQRIKGRALFIFWTWDLDRLWERVGKIIR